MTLLELAQVLVMAALVGVVVWQVLELADSLTRDVRQGLEKRRIEAVRRRSEMAIDRLSHQALDEMVSAVEQARRLQGGS